jgi:trimeric autotransporter adhesin
MTAFLNRQPTRRAGESKLRLGAVALAILIALAPATIAMSPIPATAQVVTQSPWTVNGPVIAVARSGNTIYIGGQFTFISQVTGNAVPLDYVTGAPTTPFPRVEGSVGVVVSDGAGGWFIGGDFTAVAGVPRAGLAHVMADLSISAWNPSPNGPVTAITISGSMMYVAGGFNSIGGQPHDGLAAVDVATGVASFWGPSVVGRINSIGVSGSTVYVGGSFNVIGGLSRRNIAAIDAQTGVTRAWLPDADGTVNALVVSGPTIYAGGNFANIGGRPRLGIAALDSTSGSATSWQPNFGIQGRVNALLLSGTTLYIGGQYYLLSNYSSNLTAVDITTGVPTSFSPNPTGQNSFVSALALRGSTIYVGGSFTSIGGQPRNNPAVLDSTIVAQSHENLAALDASSGVATAWTPSLDGAVTSLAPGASAIFVVGDFNRAGGAVRNGIAALDATTLVPTAWDPNAAGQSIFGNYPYVNAIVVSGSTVYVGGYFSSIGGQQRKGIAALDATTGLAKPWNANAGTASSPAWIFSLAVNGSTVYAGGQFTSMGGQTRNYVAALDATTGAVTPWNPNIGGPYPRVLSLAVDGSKIFVGGTFASVGAQSRNNLAAIDLQSGNATSWDPDPNSLVCALQPSGSTLYVGGDFNNIGGQARGYLAAFDTSSDVPTAWNPGASSTVLAMALNGSALYAGGYFSSLGGQLRNGIGAVDIATGAATSWDPGAGGSTPYVWALAPSGSTVYAGGQFATMGGQPQPYLAAISIPPTPHLQAAPPTARFSIAGVPNPARVQTGLRFTLPAAGPVSLEVFDAAGRRVATLFNHEPMVAGAHEVPLKTADLKAGLYFAKLEFGSEFATERLIVLR